MIPALVAVALTWLTATALLIRRLDQQARTAVQERADNTAALQAQAQIHAQQLDQLISLHASERAAAHPDLEALIRLVENLCQRIQAPEQAVIDHSIQVPVGPQPQFVSTEDDDAYWQHIESKEELAERVEVEEARLAGLSG